MAEQPQLSQLCELCEHINFAAILTPREYDKITGKMQAVYRPEWNGNGSSPIAPWMSTKERKRLRHPSGSIRVKVPILKTAYYEDLSESEEEEDEETNSQVYYEDRAVVVVGDSDDEEEDDDNKSMTSETRERLAAELSDIEDDEDSTGDDGEASEDANDGDDDDDDKSAATISTWSGLSHFIENNRIDLNKQAAGNWSYRHGDLYYLGSIWDVRSRRRRCELCREFWNRMRNNPVLIDEYVSKSRCVLKLMELNGRRVEDSTRVVSMLSLTFIYGYKFGNPHEADWIIRNPLVLGGTHRDVCEMDDRSSPGQILSFQDKHYGEARWKHDRCNFELLQGWLRTCTTKHNHPPLDLPIKAKMRLIDVVQMCLVEYDASDTTIPDYVALSYTWGASKPRNMLKTTQLEQFKAPGFFNGEDLHTTFRDSLTLCSNMGQKYLWIDALCIIQDSPNDKLQQIPQMREIYGRSLFTIVAAYGDNADAGLPRVSGNGSNKFKLELKDVRVQLRGSCKIYCAYNKLDIGFTENYIRGCTYLSRAWTFQEGFLSPRLLIFVGDKVYWECERCTWCDDTHWESEEIDFIGLRAIKGSTPTDVWNDRFERHAYDLRPDDAEDSIPPLNTYPAVVKEYSNRKLTWDNDVLHACNGVLAYIKEQEQSDFIFGLREKHFGNDLLFNYWTAIAPRFPGKTSIESGFPSWSWTAWKGGIQIVNQARGNSYDLAENLIPCDGVRCFTLQADGKGSHGLRVINKSGGWKFELGYIRSGEGIYDPPGLNYEYDPAIGKSKPTGSFLPETTGKEDAEITIYDQNIILADLAKHPAFSLMQPNLHIAFKTFSTLVVVILDYDDFVTMMGNMTMGGTVTHRSEGVLGNKDKIQRKVYACRRIQGGGDAETSRKQHQDHQDNSCPCCGKDAKRDLVPEGFELGPYLGRLPALSTAWNAQEYLRTVPDGLYRMLWMNNNQLPMFGHLLCKPVSPTASKDGNWDGEIMQRVSGVIGPIEIITKERQAHYCAEWGTHILV